MKCKCKPAIAIAMGVLEGLGGTTVRAQEKYSLESSVGIARSDFRGYALFNYEAKSGPFAADPTPSEHGHACHAAVKAKDYIFYL